MKNIKHDQIARLLKLYAVTDRTWLKQPFSSDDPFGAGQLAAVTESIIRGGVTMVQLREKNIGSNRYKQIAQPVQKVCQRLHIPFIIDDDIEAACSLGADGVHVGQSDTDARYVRHFVGPDSILGVSVQTVGEACAAEAAGADYLGVGAVFPTGTKRDAQTVSIVTLAQICQAVKIPVVAIGGISLDRVALLKQSGIAGIAVVSALYGVSDPFTAARNLFDACSEFCL